MSAPLNAPLLSRPATMTRSGASRGPALAVNPANPYRQPCAARARAQTPAPQRGVVSACRRAHDGLQAVAPCGRFSPASQTAFAPNGRQRSERTANLFPNSGGLTMETPATSFFYALLKFVPLGGIAQPTTEKAKSVCKPLKMLHYTLCEVLEGQGKSLPFEKPPQTAAAIRFEFGHLLRVCRGKRSAAPGLVSFNQHLFTPPHQSPESACNPHPAVRWNQTRVSSILSGVRHA